jgi:hypothetical protein
MSISRFALLNKVAVWPLIINYHFQTMICKQGDMFLQKCGFFTLFCIWSVSLLISCLYLSYLTLNSCFVFVLLLLLIINGKIHKNKRKRFYSSNKEGLICRYKSITANFCKFVLTKCQVKVRWALQGAQLWKGKRKRSHFFNWPYPM